MNWNEQFLQYICHENQFCGGEIKCITIEDKDFLVMYRVENEVMKVLELLPGINGDECISGLITAVNDSLLSERCNQKCNAAEVMLQPNVMATAKLEAASNRGYFNLIMA